MQKDTVVNSISSVMLDPAGGNHPTAIRDITDVIVVTADGAQHPWAWAGIWISAFWTHHEGSVRQLYRAVVFSIIGYFLRSKTAAKAALPGASSPGRSSTPTREDSSGE